MIRLISVLMVTGLFVPGVAFADLTFVQHAEETATGAFDSTGLWILGGGTLATIIASRFDNEVHDTWKGHQRMSADVSRYGDFWGTGIPEAILIGGQIYFDKNNGIPALEGFVLGGIVTHTAKYAIGRERPDSNTKTAMPSGHTQAAFSIAASTTESYGWKAGLPFWVLGAFTGLTRLADNAHWLSDVVAGAAIGTLFGRAGYSHHRQIQPVVIFHDGRPDGAEVALRMEW